MGIKVARLQCWHCGRSYNQFCSFKGNGYRANTRRRNHSVLPPPNVSFVGRNDFSREPVILLTFAPQQFGAKAPPTTITAACGSNEPVNV